MAHIALFCGAEVILVLPDSGDAIVTGSTRAQHLRVIYGKHRSKNVGRVAVLADIRCLNVCLVLARCVRAIVTTHAVPGDVDVIEIRRQPADGTVTIIAIIAAGNMVLAFPFGDYTVMTGTASADHLGVINEHYGHEHRRAVAIFTDVGGIDMCLVLADCLGAVMTVYTVGGNRGMIERCRQPTCSCMAIVTGICAGNMSGLFTDGDDAVMA